MKSIGSLAMVLVLATSAAAADDRETYNRRAAETDLAAFRLLDLDRDGVLTREELRRYLEQAYGVVVTETNLLVMQLSPPSSPSDKEFAGAKVRQTPSAR